MKLSVYCREGKAPTGEEYVVLNVRAKRGWVGLRAAVISNGELVRWLGRTCLHDMVPRRNAQVAMMSDLSYQTLDEN